MKDWIKCQISPLVKYRQNTTRSYLFEHIGLNVFMPLERTVGFLSIKCSYAIVMPFNFFLTI